MERWQKLSYLHMLLLAWVSVLCDLIGKAFLPYGTVGYQWCHSILGQFGYLICFLFFMEEDVRLLDEKQSLKRLRVLGLIAIGAEVLSDVLFGFPEWWISDRSAGTTVRILVEQQNFLLTMVLIGCLLFFFRKLEQWIQKEGLYLAVGTFVAAVVAILSGLGNFQYGFALPIASWMILFGYHWKIKLGKGVAFPWLYAGLVAAGAVVLSYRFYFAALVLIPLLFYNRNSKVLAVKWQQPWVKMFALGNTIFLGMGVLIQMIILLRR